MYTKIAQWGNSNAVRLPSDLLARQGLSTGSDVRVLETADGVLIARARPCYRLEDLLARMTPENTPGETNWGVAVGREVIE